MKLQNRAKLCLCISAGLMVLALILSIFGLGIIRGIDFEGGLSIKNDMGEPFDNADVEAALASAGISEYQIAKAGADQSELQLRIKMIDDETGVEELRKVLEEQLSAKYTGMKTNDATVSFVGGVASGTLLRNAIWSVVAAAAAMLIYIAIRFDFNMGVSAVFGILHDVLIMLSFMVFFRSFLQMNSTFIAAMLTIVGYSINNTIIIFDRIRENNRRASYASLPRAEIVTISVKESLGRTINTTLTTLVTILALYILGVASIKEFALPIIIGILAGVYSANLINGYIWAALTELRKDRAAQKKAAKNAKAE
ncbi:MAG: protein translocase subunit SecF [Clostridia bacterium]|nr:protein translocase subunit SecF [Clostridia bacterium]